MRVGLRAEVLADAATQNPPDLKSADIDAQRLRLLSQTGPTTQSALLLGW